MAPQNHRTRTLALAAVAALLLPMGLNSSASAKTEKWTIPAGSTITIEGKGFGHGRGLSQYGAQGAAKQGLDHQRIVDFYYPGTTWGTVGGNVKVLVSADTTDDVVVRARKGLKLRDISAKKVYTLPENGAAEWRMMIGSKKRTIVQWRPTTKGTWKTWTKFHGEGQFGAAGKPLGLVLPSGKVVQYRGLLRSAAPVVGGVARDTVNIVSMEHYLRGVVPLEIPAAWHPEAVKAQSVAARTYATYERQHPLARHYQICDTTQCQVYGGASAEHKLADAAISGTAKKIITYGGKPAFTQFGSSNGGWAAEGNLPYQVQQADPYDGWAGNPVHSWTAGVSPEAVERAWPALGTLERISVTGRTGAGDFGGRVRTITLVGTEKKVYVTGDQFRAGLGLRSNWFTFSVQPRAAKKK